MAAPLLAVLAVLGLALSGGLVQPAPALAAAPDVRDASPSGIDIDGSATDWDRGADFLADMYEAGKPDKRILSTSYARYDCATGTMYVLVETVPDWVILPSDSDNFVMNGNSQKLVDRAMAPTALRRTSGTWDLRAAEASRELAEGTYDGPIGLVAPRSSRRACVRGDIRGRRPIADGRHRLFAGAAAHAHADADPDTDTHAHGAADADADADTDTHAHAHAHTAAHADPDPDAAADTDPDPDAAADTHRHDRADGHTRDAIADHRPDP